MIAAAPLETKGDNAAPQSVPTISEPVVDTSAPIEAAEPAVKSPETEAPKGM